MNEFPALSLPSNNSQIMQRTYASTVQDPAYYRNQPYAHQTVPNFNNHEFPALNQDPEAWHGYPRENSGVCVFILKLSTLYS